MNDYDILKSMLDDLSSAVGRLERDVERLKTERDEARVARDSRWVEDAIRNYSASSAFLRCELDKLYANEGYGLLVNGADYKGAATFSVGVPCQTGFRALVCAFQRVLPLLTPGSNGLVSFPVRTRGGAFSVALLVSPDARQVVVREQNAKHVFTDLSDALEYLAQHHPETTPNALP